MLADTSASVSPDDLQRESDFADRLEKARGRHWTRVIPFARVHARRPAFRAAEGRMATPLHRRRRRTRNRSGNGHPRWRRVAARRHGAALAAGLRRQRKPGQRRARHLAGAATRHPHRHRDADRPSQAGPDAGIGFVSGPGVQWRAFPGRSDARIARIGASQSGAERGRQTDRREPGATVRRRESFAPAGQREFGGRHRAGREDLRRIAGRSAI